MKTNTKATIQDKDIKLAGGFGMFAAKNPPEAALRRAVMANLLWEKNAYQDGAQIADIIKTLIPQVPAQTVYQIAYEARHTQKLRHVPLWIACQMARHQTHRHLLGRLLPQIILRPDELAEFLALYWQDGKIPIAKQVKKGLAAAFLKFDAYQFAKYDRKNRIKLKDVMFLVHPKPQNHTQAQLFKMLANDTLPAPDTWEVALSAGCDKYQTWCRLIGENRLGALAFLKNLRNMKKAGVPYDLIKQGLLSLNTNMLLPINYISAVKYAPDFSDVLQKMMQQSLANLPKLSGHSVFVVDVSGSMNAKISSKSDMTRLDCAIAMAILASGLCEKITLYATAGNDYKSIHQTCKLSHQTDFGLRDTILKAANRLGHGGIFTRQCLDFIQSDLQKNPNYQQPKRLLVFSDSQDCDRVQKLPKPFAQNNYIIDVSAHTHGINYQGIWTAEISGWSEHFLRFIAALEGVMLPMDMSINEANLT